MEHPILNLVNEFLKSKKKPPVTFNSTLYSSGLLDSLDMFELILFLENQSYKIKNKVSNLHSIMDQIDTPAKIETLITKI